MNTNGKSKGSGRVIAPTHTETSLRDGLRARTRRAHDKLDAVMSQTGWTDPAGYAHFLGVQHAARAPIERWMSEHCPAELQPPIQAHLLEADLADMKVSVLAPINGFDLPGVADPLGTVWALAGSSLGNAMIQRQVSGSPACAHLPQRFLCDTAMHGFWKSLLPKLNLPASDDAVAASVEGAVAVFDHFLRTAETHRLEFAA